MAVPASNSPDRDNVKLRTTFRWQLNRDRRLSGRINTFPGSLDTIYVNTLGVTMFPLPMRNRRIVLYFWIVRCILDYDGFPWNRRRCCPVLQFQPSVCRKWRRGKVYDQRTAHSESEVETSKLQTCKFKDSMFQTFKFQGSKCSHSQISRFQHLKISILPNSKQSLTSKLNVTLQSRIAPD